MARFHWIDVAGRTIDIRGSARDEVITAFGCDVALHGRAGDDRLVVVVVKRGWPSAARCHGHQRGHLRGGGGDDLLEGGYGADVLVGGPGEDEDVDRGGRNVCEAEHASGC